METALKVMSWIVIVMGALAVLDSIINPSSGAMLGGTMFFVEGLLAILYIKRQEDIKYHKEKTK